MNRKKIYTDIYKSNYWNSEESVSGGGSELETTENIRKELPILFEKFKIGSVLDIPCGDFNWMKLVIKNPIQYIGADIVDELIEDNKLYHSIPNCIEFKVLDIVEDELPKVDLIIIKDLFIHFSIEDIIKSIENIKKSDSKYVLITNGTDLVRKNEEIQTGGGYRGLNMSLEPFNFSKPIYEIETLVHNSKLSMWEINKL
jgi:SAM-dependent methyltransferase